MGKRKTSKTIGSSRVDTLHTFDGFETVDAQGQVKPDPAVLKGGRPLVLFVAFFAVVVLVPPAFYTIGFLGYGLLALGLTFGTRLNRRNLVLSRTSLALFIILMAGISLLAVDLPSSEDGPLSLGVSSRLLEDESFGEWSIQSMDSVTSPDQATTTFAVYTHTNDTLGPGASATVTVVTFSARTELPDKMGPTPMERVSILMGDRIMMMLEANASDRDGVATWNCVDEMELGLVQTPQGRCTDILTIEIGVESFQWDKQARVQTFYIVPTRWTRYLEVGGSLVPLAYRTDTSSLDQARTMISSLEVKS